MRARTPSARGHRTVAAFLAVACVVALVVSASPAHAGNKITTIVRYSSSAAPIGNWTQYAADGTPLAEDPQCPSFPGVFRSSKTWVDLYGTGTPTDGAFRMNFRTTYSEAVAVAKVAIEQVQHREPSCAELYPFNLYGPINALRDTACSANTPDRPARWCTLVQLPNAPVSVNLGLDEKCRQPAYGGHWGLVSYDSWHDVHSLMYTANGPFGIKVPVDLDVAEWVGGVSNWNPVTDQPSSNGMWIGYGNVQTAAASEMAMKWYDDTAHAMGRDAIANPLAAHRAVQDAIANGAVVKGVPVAKSFHTMMQAACDMTPRIARVLDAGLVATRAGFGEDISNWVLRETGTTLCKHLQQDPDTKNFAPLACHYGTLMAVVPAIDNDTCMNLPDNPVAKAFNTNLGCTKRQHLVTLFAMLKKIMAS